MFIILKTDYLQFFFFLSDLRISSAQEMYQLISFFL